MFFLLKMYLWPATNATSERSFSKLKLIPEIKCSAADFELNYKRTLKIKGRG